MSLFSLGLTDVCLVFTFTLCLTVVNSLSESALPQNQFSTKTTYRWAHPRPSNTKDELMSISIPGKVCTASYVTVVARHGSRFPSESNMNDISDIYKRIQSKMDFDKNPDFRNWSNPFPLNKAKTLAILGEEELEAFGKRVVNKLSPLFAGRSNMSSFEFISSNPQRAKQSAVYFRKGFLTENGMVDKVQSAFQPTVNNKLIRFYDFCERYIQEVDDNEDAMKEHSIFLNGEKMRQVRDRMATKLSVDKGLLNPEEVELIFNICAYETAIYKTSPWCSLLTEQDLNILEYLNDLEEYYENAYGHDINWKQSCTLLSNIFSKIKDTMVLLDKGNIPNGNAVGEFLFGHAGTVGPLMAALGLFKDSTPLRADNYDSQTQRLFRTSKNICLASNVMMVLYKCSPANSASRVLLVENDAHDYYMKVLVNEIPVQLPVCNDDHCPVQTIVDHYSDLVNKCQLNCKVNGGVSYYVGNTNTFISILFSFSLIIYSTSTL